MERHSTDVVSLVFGLLFTAVAVVGLTDLLHLTEADVRWAAPGLLVLLGVVLVLTAGRRRSSTNGKDVPQPAAAASRSPSTAAAPGVAPGVAAGAQASDAEPAEAPDAEPAEAPDAATRGPDPDPEPDVDVDVDADVDADADPDGR